MNRGHLCILLYQTSSLERFADSCSLRPQQASSTLSAALGGYNPFDDDVDDNNNRQALIQRLHRLAFALVSGPQSQGDLLQNTCGFRLEPQVLRDFVGRLESDPEINHQKLCFEYNFVNGIARFKMPESPLHVGFGASLGSLVTQAVSDALSLPDNLEVVNLPNLPLHHPRDGGRTLPDAAWTILDQDAHPTNQHPVVAAEVAVSSPRTLYELAQRACDIIQDSNNGIMSAVVAIKL